MEMEAPRRSALERSREPSTKKPRLAEEGERDRGPSASVAADRSRPYALTRSAIGGVGAVNSKFRANDREREEKNERDDVGRGGASYQQQQELVAQYRTALAELTFNSKPIITNLTIIAGENLHSAKSIAATVCANVLEVPSEQKLPSLYLLDSIVKNIGRDYIKHFAARLPEVFCKAYKQVDTSVHPSLRHLFGTWKGVFPSSCLQSIEKELGFQPVINGSSGGTGTKSDAQTQRAPHSIHVNLKYLEARQRLQQSTRGKEISSEDTDEDVAPVDDAERPIRATSTGNMKQYSEPSKKNVQLPRREQPSDFNNAKKSYKSIRDPGFSSQLSRQPDMGVGRNIDRVNEIDEMGRNIDQVKESDEPNKSYFGAGGAVDSTDYRRNGFDADHVYGNYRTLGSVPNKNQVSSINSNRTNWPAPKSWKASEEEEYIWDDMGSRSVDYERAGNKRNSWSTDDQDKPTNLQNHKWLSTEAEHADSRLNKFDAFHHPRGSISGSEDRVHFPREHDEHFLQPNSQETEARLSKSPWPLPLCDTSLPAVALDRSISRVSGQTERRPAPLGGVLSTNENSAIPRSGFQSTLSSNLGTHVDVLGSGGMLGKPRQLPLRSPSPTFPSAPSAPTHQQKLRAPLDQDFLPVLSSQMGQNSSQLSGQFNRDKFAPFSTDLFPNSSENPSQKGRTSLNLQPSLPHASQPSLAPFLDLKQHLSSLQQSHPDLSMQTIQNETSSYASHGFRANESKGYSGAVQSSSTIDLLPNKLSSGLNIQPPLPSGPPPALALASSSPLPTSSAEMTSSHGIITPGLAPPLLAGMLPPLPPGPPPSALLLSSSSQTSNAGSASLNPLSSLLSSLVAKGIITSTATQLPAVSSSQMSKESTSQNSDLDGSTSTQPSSSLKEIAVRSPSTSSPVCDNLIGVQFKTEIVREFHPSVIDSLLDDLKHQCNTCGLRFRHQEQLQSHLDWHSSSNLEISNIDKVCRRWYPSELSWVSGDVEPQCGPVLSSSSEAVSEEQLEPMVTADESQSICMLCGEPFEDFYSVARNEWMYKATVYLNLMNGKYVARRMEEGVEGPIVHAKCISSSDIYGGATQCS